MMNFAGGVRGPSASFAFLMNKYLKVHKGPKLALKKLPGWRSMIAGFTLVSNAEEATSLSGLH